MKYRIVIRTNGAYHIEDMTFSQSLRTHGAVVSLLSSNYYFRMNFHK